MLLFHFLPRKIGELTNNVFNSIALLPTLITFVYIFLVIAIMHFDHSNYAQSVIKLFPWIQFKEMETGRTILSTLITGTISLVVLSFSMVMVVLSQAISKYSPKVIVGLISEKTHQFVLGNQLGTIIYFLILLLHLKDLESLQVPSFSITFSIILGIWSMMLFVYFIHAISQSIQITNVIRHIHNQTLEVLSKVNKQNAHYTASDVTEVDTLVYAYMTDKPGFLQDVRVDSILKVATRNNMVIKLHGYLTSYVESRTPLFHSDLTSQDLSDNDKKSIYNSIVFHHNESVKNNYVYGFTQLSEMAVKALSPGINDPGIARLCVQYLTDMFVELYYLKEHCVFRDRAGKVRLIINKISFLDLLNVCITPIRQYGEKDLVIVKALLDLLRIIAIQDSKEKRYRHALNEQARAILESCSKQEYSEIDIKSIDGLVVNMEKVDDHYFYLEKLNKRGRRSYAEQHLQKAASLQQNSDQAHTSENT